MNGNESSAPAADRKPVAPRRALRDGVYDAILERLLDGSTPQGSSLGIDSLARELEVSPTPVREALVQLEHTGLISRVALKGYRVAPPLSPEQLVELFDMRTILEAAAVERAVSQADDLVPELRAAHAQHVLCAHRVRKLRGADGRPTDFSDLRESFAADWEFHLTIIRASGNRFLLKTAESLSAQVHRLRQAADHGTTDIEQAVDEHAAILAAFESGDPERPLVAMREHLAAVARRVSADG
ncbi:GntR family transcriptional regulator [Streptomyces scopuliridis]|uniref:GntR family transcriptional regulator n=1 Tax=Streptomyces scopuliridis TaxID=452529 RepID=A0ACD4ZGR1_9ACTN|nr:GntR family transcriptional regulator [Streptomyces scopuliridis]WSB32748.1 GntR family transcriptional regulator [Streptomyces scopuliridis]WSB96997.1 GntR family transcriptional regulator [Streptomyces scopuliridis]WSC09299.1 GntR family transcriptional regulator [Streptomyces scopuliridis]